MIEKNELVAALRSVAGDLREEAKRYNDPEKSRREKAANRLEVTADIVHDIQSLAAMSVTGVVRSAVITLIDLDK